MERAEEGCLSGRILGYPRLEAAENSDPADSARPEQKSSPPFRLALAHPGLAPTRLRRSPGLPSRTFRLARLLQILLPVRAEAMGYGLRERPPDPTSGSFAEGDSSPREVASVGMKTEALRIYVCERFMKL